MLIIQLLKLPRCARFSCTRSHNYTKEEGMQLIIIIETAKFERLLKIALSHAHALKIIIVVMDIECT